MITYSKVVPEEVLASIAENKGLHTTEQRYRAVEQATIAALMAELAEQEPVAWVSEAGLKGHYILEGASTEAFRNKEDLLDEYFKAVPVPLYAHPVPDRLQEPVAWVHPDDPTRSITHLQKLGAIKDGGAIEKTTRVFSIPAYAHPYIPTKGTEEVNINKSLVSTFAIKNGFEPDAEGNVDEQLYTFASEIIEYALRALGSIQTKALR